MAWSKVTRGQYQRNGLRYASDMTDAEWRLIMRRMPARHRHGRPREVDLREVVQAILYILSTGCQWRALPHEFPPYSTVQSYFYAWRDSGRWQRIVAVLVRQARKKLRRKPMPSAAIIDSQSAPTTQAGGPRGFDPGKRISGRKRHIVTDTEGLLLAVHVHPANVQDVHGAVPLLKEMRRHFPKLRHVFADRVYRGPQLLSALSQCGPWTIEIVKRPHGVKASNCSHGDGASSAPSPGLADAAALPRTSKPSRQQRSPGSSSLISGLLTRRLARAQ